MVRNPIDNPFERVHTSIACPTALSIYPKGSAMSILPPEIPTGQILEDLKAQAAASRPKMLPLDKTWVDIVPARSEQRPKLNDLTREEIANIRRAKERVLTHCKWCDKELRARPDQKFCSSKCRTASYHAVAAQVREIQLRAEESWLQERANLVREISELRTEVAWLRLQLGPDLLPSL